MLILRVCLCICLSFAATCMRIEGEMALCDKVRSYISQRTNVRCFSVSKAAANKTQGRHLHPSLTHACIPFHTCEKLLGLLALGEF